MPTGGFDLVMKKMMRKYFADGDEGRQNYNKYGELMTLPGWKIHREMITDIGHSLMAYMLSSEFTDLKMEDKDVEQRAIYMTGTVLEFLLDPLKELQKAKRLQSINLKQGEEMHGFREAVLKQALGEKNG